MNFLIGKKQNMTNIFEEDGKFLPATIISLERMVVTKIFTEEKDGYSALQVGFGFGKKKNKTKADLGQMNGEVFQGLKEFRMKDTSKYKVGDEIDIIDVFKKGDKVVLTSRSKGKGFQGGVKRHNFKGSPRTHGHKGMWRRVGSVGTGELQRVAKGKKMPGRMGNDRVTTKGVKILEVSKDDKTIYVSSPVSGPRGAIVEIKDLKYGK